MDLSSFIFLDLNHLHDMRCDTRTLANVSKSAMPLLKNNLKLYTVSQIIIRGCKTIPVISVKMQG